jgi:hypothetical protein
MAQNILHEIRKVVSHLGNSILGWFDLASIIVNAWNNESYPKGVSSTTINFDFFCPPWHEKKCFYD